MRERVSASFWVGCALVGAFVLAGLLAGPLAPYGPHDLSGDPLTAPSLHHLLGTNDVGQDVLSQLIWGARWSLAVAVATASLSVVIGVAVGALVPVLGRVPDLILARIIDILLAIPGLPLLIVVGTLAGPNRVVLTIAISLFMWPRIARIVRSQVLTLRNRGFVVAAEGFGGGRVYVVCRHVVPAIGPLIGASFIEVAGIAIFLDAGLGFLGVGDPSAPSWGLMLNRANAYPGLYLSNAWSWWVLPPGLALTAAVVGLTFMWIGVEAILNPRLRSTHS